jgi:hypothetical protein
MKCNVCCMECCVISIRITNLTQLWKRCSIRLVSHLFCRRFVFYLCYLYLFKKNYKKTNNVLPNFTPNTRDQATRVVLKPGMNSGRKGNSCFTYDTCRVTFVLQEVRVLFMLFVFVYEYWCPARFSSNTTGVICEAGIAFPSGVHPRNTNLLQNKWETRRIEHRFHSCVRFVIRMS